MRNSNNALFFLIMSSVPSIQLFSTNIFLSKLSQTLLISVYLDEESNYMNYVEQINKSYNMLYNKKDKIP